MKILCSTLILVAVSALASGSDPSAGGFANARAEKYADAARVLILEGLERLEPGLLNIEGVRDTIYLGYPNTGDISVPKFADPPQDFLESLSTSRILFAPLSQKPEGRWNKYMVVDFNLHHCCAGDTVRMHMTEDTHGIKQRLLPEGQIFVTPTQAGAFATLVHTAAGWKIVMWKRMLMM